MLLLLFAAACAPRGWAQTPLRKLVGDTLNTLVNDRIRVGEVTVRHIHINRKGKAVTVDANDCLAYMPMRPENVKQIYAAIRSQLPAEYRTYRIICRTKGYDIETLIPNLYRTGKTDAKRLPLHMPAGTPLLTNTSRPHHPSRGLQGRHIALWHSHGLHYDQRLARWEWQRARLFQTVEDMYTQAYVIPFLVPMLEQAGANVLLPRERDPQVHEVVVDNDMPASTSRYTEHPDSIVWTTGDSAGFAHPKATYLFGENPFRMGTFRQCATTRFTARLCTAEWTPDIPQSGRYAVYVSYKTLPNSSQRARYTVYHRGGMTRFEVNQQMCGGTWVYLGHFDFGAGVSERGKVVLDNYDPERDRVVTADGVKFGGGMGNMARLPLVADTISLTDGDTVLYLPSPHHIPEASGYPRYAEGARYWLQWAGTPDSVYSRTRGQNDYLDDFQSRGFWVNYMAGGSAVMPDEEGLRVPIDLSLGFHSDAGTAGGDSIVGTLAICSTRDEEKRGTYRNGVSRMAARDLADVVQTQIVHDLRHTIAPEWTRRELWDKSYSESRVPEVPGMLLELLSHQNFADMRYGLDPRFRFTVCRAVYKGILKYLAAAHHTEYTVQPLPVEAFAIRFTDESEVELSWRPTPDPLEPSAQARQYVVYMQVDSTGFDNGFLLNDTVCRFRLNPDRLYSFKVAAVNEGGESFPSETLSACRTSQDLGTVLIVNGFDRVSAPASFAVDSTLAGFVNEVDAGVPYGSDLSFVGPQYEFRRNVPWTDDDDPGFGASHATHEATAVAGNTFDYPALHGKAIQAAGYSFTSCSARAFAEGRIPEAADYPVIDLILGKQRETCLGNDTSALAFKTFPLALQEQIERYCQQGGNLLVSGAYAASDLWHGNDTTGRDRRFVSEVLRCRLRNTQGGKSGRVRTVPSEVTAFQTSEFGYYHEPNAVRYHVTSPDAIEPQDSDGHTVCRYADGGMSAGVACDAGIYKTCVFGFPFETIKEETERNKLMKAILTFLQQ